MPERYIYRTGKSTDALAFFDVDFRSNDPTEQTPRLEDDETISSFVPSVDSVGLTISSGAYAPSIHASGKGVRIWLEAGTVGATYHVTAAIVTSGSAAKSFLARSYSRTFAVEIGDVVAGSIIQLGPTNVDVRSYGADPNYSSDSTQAFRDALSGASPGTQINVPTGRYRVGDGASDIFTFPYQGVKLVGPEQGQMGGPRVFGSDDTLSGAQLNVHGTGQLFHLRRNSAVKNLTLYYPEQNVNSAPVPCGLTFYVHQNEHHVTIENIVAVNPYDFVSIAPTGVAGPTHIRHVMAWPLHSGIVAGRAPGVLLHEVSFNNIDSASGATLIAWVQANAVAYQLGGVEQFDITDCFAFGYRDGLLFENVTGSPFYGEYGSWKGGGFDQCNNCVRVAPTTSLGCLGFKMSSAQLIPNVGGEAVLIEDNHVPASDAEKPWLSFDAVGVHQFAGHQRALRAAASSYANVLWEKSAWLNMTVAGATNSSANAKLILDKIGMSSGVTRSTGAGSITDLHPVTL